VISFLACLEVMGASVHSRVSIAFAQIGSWGLPFSKIPHLATSWARAKVPHPGSLSARVVAHQALRKRSLAFARATVRRQKAIARDEPGFAGHRVKNSVSPGLIGSTVPPSAEEELQFAAFLEAN